jgi:uncharacterized repeat protein (TIGR01451 family)
VPGTAGALHELTLTQPLAANASVTLEASLPAGTLAAGAHTLWVLADATGSVTELSETNNALSATVTLERPNTAPMAAVDTYTTPESTLLSVAAPGVLTNDTDAEDTALTAVVASAPAHGTLTLNADGSFTYQPTPGYSGPDYFTYRASDGVLVSTPGTVSVTVTDVNRAPVAADVTVTTPAAQPVVVTLSATDADSDSLTYGIVTQPTHGTLSGVSGNQVTYTPTAGYSGPDSFTYRASDGVLQSAPATVGVTVTPVNRAPVASAVSVSTSTGEAVTVTLAATDPDGDPLTFSVVTQPAHGTLGPISGNQVTYTPANGYTGSDGFTYRASDGLVHSAAATVSVAVTGAPDLALTKTHTGSFTVGTNGKYTLTVSNVGSAPTSGPITLVDSLPAGLSYVSFTGTGWTCSAAAPNVACSRTQALAPQATSTVTLTVSVAAAAVPSVVNSAIVSLEGDTNATNNSAEDPTTVNQTADKAKPYCQVTRVATDAQGRQFIEVTIRDTGSGLKSIQITKQTNISIAIPTFPVGSKETYMVVGTKVDQASPAQIELKVTDVAGNYILCDPVMTVITKLPNQPERQVFGELPEAEHLVQVRNGSPNGVKQLVIEVNNKKFTLKDLEPGEIRRLDIASAMKQGDNNKVVLESHGGKKGAWIEVLIADSLPPWEDDPEQEPTLDGERRRPASPAAPASPGAPTAPATSTVPAEPTLSSAAPTAQTGQQPAVPPATPVPTVTPQTQATPQPSATPVTIGDGAARNGDGPSRAAARGCRSAVTRRAALPRPGESDWLRPVRRRRRRGLN